MKAITSLFLCAAFVLAMPALSASGGEVAYQNLPGADFKPGALKLPLTVHERSGVERRGAVVTSGVPFPPGFLADAGKLAVVDKDGKPVPSQAVTMCRWWKPGYDDSVQWALISFPADVPAGGTATYYLTDDGKAAAPASPLKVAKSDKELAIETGVASFAVPMQGEALISRAALGGAKVIDGAGLRALVTAGEWADRGLKAGDKLVATHDAAGVTVEESGPARVVVCIKGGFAPGDKEKKFYDYTARLYFTAGSPAVRVVYTISNGRLDPTLVKGSRFAYIWPIKDASLSGELALGAEATASTLVAGKAFEQAVGGDALNVFQKNLDGYTVTLGGKELVAGARHNGVIDVRGGGCGVAVARRYLSSEWPGSMGASAKAFTVGLFPAEANEVFPIGHGMRKSWDVRITLHGEKSPDLAGCFNEHDALLLFRPDPAWMVRAAGVTGSWSAGLYLPKSPGKPALRRASGGHEKQSSGWDRFGVISAWNAGGAHWNENTAFFNWVTSGNGAEFDNSEISTLWAADQCPVQYDNPDLSSFFPLLDTGNTDHCRLKVQAYPEYKSRASWGRPDTGHMGMWMWIEYYLLTGDMRCREAAIHLGEMGHADLWKFVHDDRKDGNGPLNYPFPNCKKRDADTEPDFKLDTRYRGWPLYCMAQKYMLTGEASMLDDMRNAARAFRNTARACPIGQLVADAAGKDGTEPTEYSPNITRNGGGTDSQDREWKRSASLVASNFYSGIITYGLREYYIATRDPEILDALVGQVDRFCQYTMIRNPEGKPAGWSYMFGDYWGPYTWEDTKNPKTGQCGAGFTSSNELPSDAIGRLYPLTGRADLLDVLQYADKANSGSNRTIALAMAVNHPKVDGTAPAAVKDLAAEALGGGKVKLTWTAPAAGGEKNQLSFYQVKWSTAAIVERVKGWPDRTEPLPATRKDWLERSAAFNARQRSFWAANSAPNAPKPGAPGAKESVTLENLPAGELNFAVKAWNDSMNIGEISNVVKVTVK